MSSPSKSQLFWQSREFGLFCHFGINTFYGKEWSDGTLSPLRFSPTRLDPAQWVEEAQNAGMKYVVFTAKHHDGFCLWPSKTTGYSVASSPLKGDVVAEVAGACAAAKMPLGLYLSPWDRNAPCYEEPLAYDEFYCAQLTELCTRYGELFEIWLDGAGSEGRVYNWDKIMGVIDTHQPGAVVFNMGRPTIRWIGNEDGLAQDPCNYAVSDLQISAFTGQSKQLSAPKTYLPPECDVAIRQNWFWQDDDLATLKSKEHLLGIFYRSLGRGANLLLNLGPNRDGLLDEHDVARLQETASERRRRFAAPVEAQTKTIEGGVELDFGRLVSFDHLVLREAYHEGQKIDGYRVENGETSQTICHGQTIGHQKWEVFPQIRARTLRVLWEKNTSPGAKLLGVQAFSTGIETLPALGAHLDYDAWAAKADKP